ADEGKRSGFSPQAEYIFRKQLEEADYLMIGRSDQLSSEQIQLLCERLSIAAPGVPVLAISPRTGEGVDQVIEMIQSDTLPGGRLLDIDYDVYADGEAELGWVNLAATLDLESEIDPDEMVQQLLRRMAAVIATSAGNPGETGPPEIAHLKASVRGDDVQAVANVVDSSGGVDVGLLAGRPVGGSIQLLVNARVAMDPSELEHIVRQQVGAWVTTHAARCENLHANALRPGRPTPTHRVTVKG
ncbi:MAG: cobalamin biosynthesis protein P47K, partial [Planctomycetota bacterium]